MTRPKVNILERIERHAIEMRDGECWITDYKPSIWGYVHVNNKRLHRIAWEAHNAEPIPKGMVIMHTCDNRACFNPEHLVVGTQQENIADAISKGRFDHMHEPCPCPRNDLGQYTSAP